MARKKKTGNKDNSFLFDEDESPQLEIDMGRERRQKHQYHQRRADDVFDRLNADYQEYVAKFGRTWLMGG